MCACRRPRPTPLCSTRCSTRRGSSSSSWYAALRSRSRWCPLCPVVLSVLESSPRACQVFPLLPFSPVFAFSSGGLSSRVWRLCTHMFACLCVRATPRLSAMSVRVCCCPGKALSCFLPTSYMRSHRFSLLNPFSSLLFRCSPPTGLH